MNKGGSDDSTYFYTKKLGMKANEWKESRLEDERGEEERIVSSHWRNSEGVGLGITVDSQFYTAPASPAYSEKYSTQNDSIRRLE
jgi:hypothetical protein